jgi:hypothetical protein
MYLVNNFKLYNHNKNLCYKKYFKNYDIPLQYANKTFRYCFKNYLRPTFDFKK